MRMTRSSGMACVAALAVCAEALAASACKPCLEDAKQIMGQMEAGKSTAAKLIAAAEAHSKGQAVGLICDWVKGAWDAKVFCVVDGKVQTVSMDAAGSATKMEEATGMESLVPVASAMAASKLNLTKVVEAAEGRTRGQLLAVVAVAGDEATSFDCYCTKKDKEVLIRVPVDSAGKAGKVTDAEFLPGEGHKAHPVKPKVKAG